MPTYPLYNIIYLQLEELQGWPHQSCKRCEKMTRDLKKFREEIIESQATLADQLSECMAKDEKDETFEVKLDEEEETYLVEPVKEEIPQGYFEDSVNEVVQDADTGEMKINEGDEIMENYEQIAEEEEDEYNVKGEEGEDEDDEVGDKEEEMDEPASKKPKSRARGRKVFFLMRHGNRTFTEEEEQELEGHMRNMNLLVCHLCREEVDSMEEFSIHFHKKHKTYAYIYCCNSKRRLGTVALDHIQYHLNEDAFKCNICNRRMRDRLLLKNHIKIYHTEPQKFACDQCGKTFGAIGRLNFHKKSHTKPHKCHYCNKGGFWSWWEFDWRQS